MFILLLVIHVAACIVLIAVILLQAGRGGGLSEAFGGETQSLLGTQAPVVLKKATTISAIVFLATSLLLGILTARKGRSLFQQQGLPAVPPVSQQTAIPPEAPAAQSGESQPATDTE
ncbi:MAG: preprotein translocase subunit SecG [Candidatus Omnitrophota bacterium]|jgi:preprotein translocase subunit SecG